MPEISRFYGIIIKMFFKPKEHEPVSYTHLLQSRGAWKKRTHSRHTMA